MQFGSRLSDSELQLGEHALLNLGGVGVPVVGRHPLFIMDEKTGTKAESAFLPRGLFGKEPEPGGICKFRVIRVFDDDVEVEYVSEKKVEKEPSADEQLDKMAADNAESGEMIY